MPKTVADAMTSDPIVVNPETPLQEAIKIIAEKRISGLPVVDQAGKLIGVISESDLMWQETGVEPPPYIMFLDSVIYLKNPARYNKEIHKALGQTVGDVMSEKKPITVKPSKSLREAAHLMNEKDVGRLIVVDDASQVIGILTRGDIVRDLASQED